MPTAKFVAVVKNVNTSGYDNYLQKLKRNRPNPITNPIPFQPNGCKSCKLFTKKGEHLSYDSYLNSIKTHIVKNKLNVGVNIDCKCSEEVPAVNISNTIYYLEYNENIENENDNKILLIDNDENGDNQILLLDNSTTSIVHLRDVITRYSLTSLS
jgi:hypothetical protein